MKIKVIILSLLSFVVVGSALGQVEQDDMYFNAKDRAKLREAEKSNSIALASAKQSRQGSDEDSNPTDSYSARNVNPEFTSRSQSETSKADEEDYYVPNYRYANQSYFNDFNRNYNNWFNNPWYRTNSWGSSMNGWNSPYYGSVYDSWGGANPYYRSGWSSGFSFYYGRSWNYGMNNCFSCSPYAYYDPYYDFYNPYYGYNSFNPYWGRPSYYGGGWNRPTRVVYIENDDYRTNYGKRSSRSGQINRDRDSGTRGNGRVVDGRDGRTNSGGRVNREQEYYNNTWRNTNRSNTNSSYTTPARTATPSWNSNDNNNNTNSNSNSNSRTSWESQQRSTPSYTPAPSRSSDAGRSSTPSGGGSSGSGSRSSRGN